MCWILPGTKSFLNFAGKLLHLWGICKSPRTSTNWNKLIHIWICDRLVKKVLHKLSVYSIIHFTYHYGSVFCHCTGGTQKLKNVFTERCNNKKMFSTLVCHYAQTNTTVRNHRQPLHGPVRLTLPKNKLLRHLSLNSAQVLPTKTQPYNQWKSNPWSVRPTLDVNVKRLNVFVISDAYF